jgi:hypothetical protein
VKAHQSRVVGAITIPQKIPISSRLAQFTVESQVRPGVPQGGLLTIGGVRHAIDGAIHFGEHRVFAVARQQQGLLPGAGCVIGGIEWGHGKPLCLTTSQ